MQGSSFSATWSSRLGGAGLALLAIGPGLTHAGVTQPMGGFLVFQVGLLLGLIALLLGIVGFFRTGSGSGRGGREHALVGLGLGVAVLAVVAFSARDGAGVPAINDVTTNTADPPEFVALREVEANRDRDMGFPGPLFADMGHEAYVEQHDAAYPDLTTLEISLPPAQALGAVNAAAKKLGWEVVSTDPQTFTLEATDTTAIFRFVDDVVVRVRPDGSGSQVDVRSKSRDGRGDLGANAARIRALRDEIGG